MLRLLHASLILLASYSFELYSGEACGTEFQRDCDERDIYLLIDRSYDAYSAGDQLLYQELEEKVKIRCKESVSKHLELVCRGYRFMHQARNSDPLEDNQEFIKDAKEFISDFHKLNFFHTDFLFFYRYLMKNYSSYDDTLYDYLKENIMVSKPELSNNNEDDYIYALAHWQLEYTLLIQNLERDEELILKNYEKTLDLFEKSKGKKSKEYLRTKLNLAYYYFNYYYIDISYLTKSHKSCQEIILNSNLEDDILTHLSCWLVFHEIEFEKNSGSTQKGFYYKVYLENYLKAISEYDYFNVSVDEDFLDTFPSYFYGLSCYERRVAWNLYQDLWDLRWEIFTGKGVLDKHREDFESLYSDISITADALWCMEEGINLELTKDLVVDLKTAINKSFLVDISKSDTAELTIILEAIDILSIYISDDEQESLEQKLYQKLLQEVDWFEKNTTSFKQSHYDLALLLIEFLGYDETNKLTMLQKINWIKGLFIEYANGAGLDSSDVVTFGLLTTGLYAAGFQEEAYQNYLDLFSFFPLSMSSDLDPFIGDGYHAKTRHAMNSLIIKSGYSDIVNEDLFQNLKYLDRGPLELSIMISKLSQGIEKKVIDEFLKAERLKSRFITEYSEDLLTEDFSSRSQEDILNSIKNFNNLTTVQKSKLYAFLYPDTSLDSIRSMVENDETLILLYSFSTTYKNFITSIAINKSEEIIEIKDITQIGDLNLEEHIELIEKEMKKSIFTGDKNYINSIDMLSDILIPNIELRDKIIFISNLDEFISPSLLRKENKWLIEDREITVHFSLVDFLTEEETSYTLPSNYIGIGDVDYSGFGGIYETLPNTSLELKNSSLEFLNKKIFLGKEANETSLKNIDLSNALVHFATHTSKSDDSNNQLPSIVLAKNELNDGYLDVFEISDLNFNDSHIVLAACDTDSSIYEDTDQFSGFIKSFQISGAKSILATRWEIETNSAQTVTQSYIKKIKNQLNPQKALAETQRELINLNYHPFFWSGYFVIE